MREYIILMITASAGALSECPLLRYNFPIRRKFEANKR